MAPAKNLPQLLNLAYVGYNRALVPGVDFAPEFNADGSIKATFCNQFIQYICNGYGYGDFNGMTANEMVDFMADFKNGWISPTDDQVAQSHANNGVIVISGFKNPAGHGHVCLVLPGTIEKSGSFGRAVPKVANVGKDVFFGKKLSFAFQASDAPAYYVLGGMV